MFDSPLLSAPPETPIAAPDSADDSTGAEPEQSRTETSQPSGESPARRDVETVESADAAGASTSAPSLASGTTADSSAPDTSSEADPETSLQYAVAMLEANDVSLPDGARSSITGLYRHCREENATFRRRPPAAGDLAFFHNTADIDGDGRNNDWYTFVGLVERVDDSETVHFLGYRGGEVRELAMNLRRAKTGEEDGRRLNSQLRARRPDDPEYTQYMAGQLFAGYCSLLGDRSKFYVLDEWQPGMEVSSPTAQSGSGE
ncbi:MAG: hypothetical protein ABEL76_03670 [Bradymonadaceae bacterium]